VLRSAGFDESAEKTSGVRIGHEEEILGMPLDCDAERMIRDFHALHDPVRGASDNPERTQFGGRLFQLKRLMVPAVDFEPRRFGCPG